MQQLQIIMIMIILFEGQFMSLGLLLKAIRKIGQTLHQYYFKHFNQILFKKSIFIYFIYKMIDLLMLFIYIKTLLIYERYILFKILFISYL